LPENDLYISFTINCFVKNTGPAIVALTAYQTQFSPDGAGLCGLDVDSVNSSSDYFAYLYIPVSETMLHQRRMLVGD
jgi:hypothetical protein